MGDANAVSPSGVSQQDLRNDTEVSANAQSIPTVQPVLSRPMWGAFPKVAALNSFAFVSKISIDNGMLTLSIRLRPIPAIR